MRRLPAFGMTRPHPRWAGSRNRDADYFASSSSRSCVRLASSFGLLDPSFSHRSRSRGRTSSRG